MTVKELIQMLLDYPMDSTVNTHSGEVATTYISEGTVTLVLTSEM